MLLRNKKRTVLFLLSLLALMLFATACSPSKAEKLNEEGNDAFAQQAFQDALVSYQTAQIEEPELAEPYYNAANALYRQGAYAEALKQMNLALSFAAGEELAQAGLYNLGNSSYNQQDLQTAVASYTEALLLNPDDQDAKYNLELALQQLQQQQQNEEQQEQEQEQDQEQEQEESEEGESEEEEQQDQGEQEQEQEGQQEEEQESDSQEGEEEQEQEGQQGEEEQEQEQEGQGQPQEGQPEEPQEGQLNEQPAPGQRMTEEQAEQLLAAIARDGQTLQEKLGQIFAVPWSPPVQDW